MMRKGLEILGWLTALLIFIFASHAALAQTVPHREERVLRRANGEPRTVVVFVPDIIQVTPLEAHAAQAGAPQREAAPAPKIDEGEDLNAGSIVRSARTLYVSPSRRIDKKYVEYKLQKYTELRDWGLMIVEDARVADLVLKIDQTALNYIFSITDPRTSIVVVSGKVVAINDRLAAEYLGKEIVKKIKDVRASGDARRKSPARKRDRVDKREMEEEDEP